MDPVRLVGATVALRNPVGVLLAALLAAAVLATVTPMDLLSAGIVAVAAATGAFAVRNPDWRAAVVRRTGVDGSAWIGAGVLFVAGVGYTYAVGDPRAFCPGSTHRGCLTGYGYATVAFAAGCFAAALAVGNLPRYRRVTTVPTAVGEVEPGPVAVSGRVEPVGSGLPGRADDAVAVRRVVEEPHDLPGSGYRTVESEAAAEPFYVSDGDDRLLVVPDALDEHAAAEWWSSETDERGDGRRTHAWSLSREESVFVAGRATPVDRTEYPDGMAVGVEAPATVAASSRDAVVRAVKRRVVAGGVLAVVVGGGGLVAMVLLA